MTTWTELLGKNRKDTTAQKYAPRVRLNNSLHMLADDIEVSMANHAAEHGILPEDVLDWVTNELQNRRTVCRLRP